MLLKLIQVFQVVEKLEKIHKLSELEIKYIFKNKKKSQQKTSIIYSGGYYNQSF